jgi:hypothetical protein
VRSSVARTIAGTSTSPSFAAARTRRSPSTRRYPPSPAGATTTGTIMPRRSIKRASSSTSASTSARGLNPSATSIAERASVRRSPDCFSCCGVI